MKLGLFTVPLADRPLPEALDYARSLGCEAVELGTGGYPGRDHCDPARLLADTTALEKFRRIAGRGGLEVSALSCHGNPLHPNENVARTHDEDFRDTVRLAEELGVETVVTFFGCPGDSEGSKRPNWVVCPWRRTSWKSWSGSGVKRSRSTGRRRRLSPGTTQYGSPSSFIPVSWCITPTRTGGCARSRATLWA